MSMWGSGFRLYVPMYFWARGLRAFHLQGMEGRRTQAFGVKAKGCGLRPRAMDSRIAEESSLGDSGSPAPGNQTRQFRDKDSR